VNISQPKERSEKFDDVDDDDDNNNNNNKLRSEKFDDNNNDNNIFKLAVARWQWLLCMYINMK